MIKKSQNSKRKIIALSLITILIFTLYGCGDETDYSLSDDSAALENDLPKKLSDIDVFYEYEVTKAYQDIRELDEAYDKSSAQMDNCFVVGAMVHNDNLYYEFMEKCRNNEDAFIRVVQSTTEGDTIIYDVLHLAKTNENDEEIQLVIDGTRDEFAAEADRNITLKHYTGTMEYEEEGHLYWVVYNGNPDEVSINNENTFVIVLIS